MPRSEPPAQPAPLRIALLLDKPAASKYAYDFARWAQDRPDLIITHLILHPASARITLWSRVLARLKRDGPFRGTTDLAASLLFHIIFTVERVLLNRTERYRDHWREFDLCPIVPDQIIITPIISKSGFVYRFSVDDIKTVKSLDLDLMILCGHRILRGEILQAAKMGVLSFHHADGRIIRGGPPGFWEVYFRRDTTGFTIQRLTEELDGGDILMRGHVTTQYYYLLNQAALFEKSNFYLKSIVEKIASKRTLPPILPKFPYANKLVRSPTAVESVVYLARLLSVIVKSKCPKLFGFHDRWNVGFVCGDWPSAVLWRGSTLKNPPFHFLADPFVVARDGKDFCFVEDFDYRTQRGAIAVYVITDGAASRVGMALQEPFHLSFPFIFEHKGELFMCPETEQIRNIRIYRCLEFPLRWKLEKVVMQNIAAADTMLFDMNGKWWLFTNIDRSGAGEYFELSIFSADSPFSDRWTPHPQNPIFVDARRARNGGLIRDGHRHFRISQGQGFDRYGKKALLNEITELTDTSYSEAVVCELTPDFKRGIVGTHHFHSNGTTTVFDYVKLSRISK